MQVRVEQVGPKMAQEWIDRSHNVSQRSLSRRRVERLAHAIIEGQWQLTHQAVALNAEGEVLDGQHRLAAIVAAGQELGTDFEVPLLVAYEADPSTFDVIDTGAARSTADTLKIAGYTRTPVLAATVRAVMTYDQIKGTTKDWSNASGRLTTSDIVEFLEVKANKQRAHAALDIGFRVSGAVGRHGIQTGIAASAWVAMIQGNRGALGADAMHEFFERLSDGAMLASRSPILALRRWIIGDNGFARTPVAYRRQMAMATVIKSMNDWAVQRERGVVSYKVGLEAMPVLLTRKEADEILDAKEHALHEGLPVDNGEDEDA